MSTILNLRTRPSRTAESRANKHTLIEIQQTLKTF